jgi:hypothetical protein
MNNSSDNTASPLQEQFGFAVTNFLMQMVNVEITNQTCRSALTFAAPQLATLDRQKLTVAMANPVVRDIFVTLEQKLGSTITDTLQEGMTEGSLKKAARSVDAAAIVFSHSLLDATLYTFCSICYRARPADWFAFASERKIKVGDLLSKSALDLMMEKAKLCLEELERESLSSKSNKLHAICKPPTKAAYIENYHFSSAELEKFDATRIGIVHGMQFKRPLQDVQATLDFALKTGLYFAVMVARKYQLQMHAGTDFLSKLSAELA